MTLKKVKVVFQIYLDANISNSVITDTGSVPKAYGESNDHVIEM